MRAEAGMRPHHHHHDGAEERARLHCTAVTKGGTRDDVTNPARPGRRPNSKDQKDQKTLKGRGRRRNWHAGPGSRRPRCGSLGSPARASESSPPPRAAAAAPRRHGDGIG